MFKDESIKFKYTWRPYQQKVLDECDKHIKDKKIHIVAAPGSGKTVLGLEIARRLAQPTLILSPTLTIKYQWVDRFINIFMPEDKKDVDWISQNIYDLKYFNSVTYQALHYAYKRQNKAEKIEDTDDEIEEEKTIIDIADIEKYNLIEEIKKQKIKTIVLDEAHHLKTQWHKSLTKVIEGLEDVTIISLTATPPYDEEYSGWKKYIDLCGQIDAEITVPELVAVDNLCPHQDYIFFNALIEEEKKYIEEFKINVKKICEDLKQNNSFIQFILTHPYLVSTEKYEKDILEVPEYYSSMIVFLNSANIKVDKSKIKILGHNEKIPIFTMEWLEILLQNLIFKDKENFLENADKLKIIEDIEKSLRQLGVIEKNKVMIINSDVLKRYLVNSIGKIESINKIVKIETESLKEKLRMVILTDYIRKEYLNDFNGKINKIGVFPIFIKILKEHQNENMAILTGTMFVIPKMQKENIIVECKNLGIDEETLSFSDFSISEKYIIVKNLNSQRNLLMKAIANIFAKGNINIIIGTKALLGEGWDEPSINSLILASFVGSYMLSNQMRGRAIRVNEDKYKTANVWHLVSACEDKEQIIKNVDYMMLKRRFNCFVGIGYQEDIIENGIDRINILPKNFDEKSIEVYTEQLIPIAVNRKNMYEKWKYLASRFTKDNMKIVQNIEVDESIVKNKFRIINIKKLLKDICLIILLMFIQSMINGIDQDSTIVQSLLMGIIATVIAIISFKRALIIIGKIFLVGSPKKILKQIGKITLESLCKYKYIKTDYDEIKIVVNESKKNINVALFGVTEYENNIFVQAMKDIFCKVENQRYIVIRYAKNIKMIYLYYNVPEILAQNKENAEYFFEKWNAKIENSELIYTHTQQGRKILLNARKNSFEYNEQINEKKKAISKWK